MTVDEKSAAVFASPAAFPPWFLSLVSGAFVWVGVP